MGGKKKLIFALCDFHEFIDQKGTHNAKTFQNEFAAKNTAGVIGTLRTPFKMRRDGTSHIVCAWREVGAHEGISHNGVAPLAEVVSLIAKHKELAVVSVARQRS